MELLDGYVLHKPDHVTLPPPGRHFPRWQRLRRWALAEYHRMIELGVLTTAGRVELLDGYLVNKMAQNDPHHSTVQRLTLDLVRAVPAGWQPRVQLPVDIHDQEPEPDGAVVRGDRRAYDHRKPTGNDFGVVIEVSDSSLRIDRGLKAELYARGGIPVYWIVNLTDGVIEVYTDPDPASSPRRTVPAPTTPPASRCPSCSTACPSRTCRWPTRCRNLAARGANGPHSPLLTPAR